MYPVITFTTLDDTDRVEVCSCDQRCGSGMFIPDPNFFHPGFRNRIKEFKYPVF
jgi:hypothetical protein